MPKSPWNRITKRRRRELRPKLMKEYSRGEYPARLHEAATMLQRGLSHYSMDQKIDFIQRHTAEASYSLALYEKQIGQQIPTTGQYVVIQKTEENVDRLIHNIVEVIANQTTREWVPKVEERVEKYLKAKGIPVQGTTDRFILQKAILDVSQRRAQTVLFQLNLPAIERAYFQLRKINRAEILGIDRRTNAIQRKTVIRERLTPEERMAVNATRDKLVEKFSGTIMDLYRKKTDAKEKGNSTMEIEDKIQHVFRLMEDELSSKPRRILEELRRGSQKMQQLPAAPAITTAPKIKPGKREERMRQHETKQKAGKSDEKRPAKENVARIPEKPFDPVGETLQKIESEGGDSELLRSRLKDRSISSKDIAQLTTAAPPTRKIFFTIAGDPEFQRRFGNRSLSALIKGLDFIGTVPKNPQGVNKRFQQLQAGKLLEFLRRSGYLIVKDGNITITRL